MTLAIQGSRDIVSVPDVRVRDNGMEAMIRNSLAILTPALKMLVEESIIITAQSQNIPRVVAMPTAKAVSNCVVDGCASKTERVAEQCCLRKS